MKIFLRQLLAGSLLLWFGLGAFAGRIYPVLSPANRQHVNDAINGLANPSLFNFLALVSVGIVSLRVIFRGPVTGALSRTEQVLLFGLPGVALSLCVPFFISVAGFIWGHPANPALTNLAVMAVLGFIWSAGFLLLLILPAHANVPPRRLKLKHDFYVIVLVSMSLAGVIYYHQ
jgi:hypothetical protein